MRRTKPSASKSFSDARVLALGSSLLMTCVPRTAIAASTSKGALKTCSDCHSRTSGARWAAADAPCTRCLLTMPTISPGLPARAVIVSIAATVLPAGYRSLSSWTATSAARGSTAQENTRWSEIGGGTRLVTRTVSRPCRDDWVALLSHCTLAALVTSVSRLSTTTSVRCVSALAQLIRAKASPWYPGASALSSTVKGASLDGIAWACA